jgi:threonine dehydrogenase-like Zn-dependent dehydrogenase
MSISHATARALCAEERPATAIGALHVEIPDPSLPPCPTPLFSIHFPCRCEHGVILKVVATNICGSDIHMVRARTTAPIGQTLGHEITGEVIETGRDVEYVKKGDIVSVPFNIACGRCPNCKVGLTGICLNVNPARPGAAYGAWEGQEGGGGGEESRASFVAPPAPPAARSQPSSFLSLLVGYVDMGGWRGGQVRLVEWEGRASDDNHHPLPRSRPTPLLSPLSRPLFPTHTRRPSTSWSRTPTSTSSA